MATFTLQARVPVELADELRQRAVEDGISVSALIRASVRRSLESSEAAVVGDLARVDRGGDQHELYVQ